MKLYQIFNLTSPCMCKLTHFFVALFLRKILNMKLKPRRANPYSLVTVCFSFLQLVFYMIKEWVNMFWITSHLQRSSLNSFNMDSHKHFFSNIKMDRFLMSLHKRSMGCTYTFDTFIDWIWFKRFQSARKSRITARHCDRSYRQFEAWLFYC